MYSDWIRKVEGKNDNSIREKKEPRAGVRRGNDPLPTGHWDWTNENIQTLVEQARTEQRLYTSDSMGLYRNRALHFIHDPQQVGGNTYSEQQEVVSGVVSGARTTPRSMYNLDFGRDIYPFLPDGGETTDS